MARRIGLIICSFWLIIAFPAMGQTSDSGLLDGGFESDATQSPWRWTPGFDASFDAVAYEGRQSLRLDRESHSSGAFVSAAQAIDARPFRGKAFRFRAVARTALTGGQPGGAGLWVRVDRENGARGYFDNMSDRPIRSREWATYEISGPIAEDAVKITVGFLLNGTGSAWVDAASLELQDRPQANIEAATLSPRSLRNLQAFARLYGFARWFSAASEPNDPGWTTLAVEGAKDVRAATNDRDLIVRLNRWFAPEAPQMSLGASETTVIGSSANALTRWRHAGVALGTPIYRSERVTAAAPVTWRSALVDGLTVSMEVTGPTPPAGTHAATTAAAPSLSLDDPAVRAGGVIIAWNVLRHFYPYFDDGGTSWDASLEGWLAAAWQAEGQAPYQAMLERLIASLNDGHGLVEPSGARFRLPLLWEPLSSGLVVTMTPAWSDAEVRVGDEIVAMDGADVADRLADEMRQVAASTAARRKLKAADRILARETDLGVPVTVRHRDGQLEDVVLRPVAAERMTGLLSEPRPAPITWRPEGVWYFDLTRLSTNALENALDQVRPGQPVVFDVRGYPREVLPRFLGRLTSADIATPHFLLPINLMPDQTDRSWEDVGWIVHPAGPRLTGPVVFLTDARAISYAETVMAMVTQHQLGRIVGSPTAGTNGNINPLSLPGGLRLVWTGMKVENADGSPLMGRGVAPDVFVERTLEGVRSGRDEVFEVGLGEALRLQAQAR